MTSLSQMNRSDVSSGISIPLPGVPSNEDTSYKNFQNPQPTSDELMSAVLKELKINNLHLSKISDMWIDKEEVEDA